MIIRKSQAEIELMAAAGEVVAATLALLGENIRAGVTTAELDALAEEFILSQGGEPTFKGYRGYPAATCLSPNDMIVHGIPGDYALEEGDILAADVGVTLQGFVADSAFTFGVGEIPEEAERLLEACKSALDAAIEQCQEGNRSRMSPMPCNGWPKAPDSRWYGSFPGTASAARCTRIRRSSTSASRDAGRCSPRA